MLSSAQGTVPLSDCGGSTRIDTLTKQINSGTRQAHTNLNRLIVDRLPLALPPHALDSRIYATGLLRFAQIYFAFESAWAKVLDDIPIKADPRNLRAETILEHLYLPQISRTKPLQEDLCYLLQISPQELSNRAQDTLRFPSLQAFIHHIELTTASRPLILVAYAWVMYLALFNGGRWIRSQLLSAKNDTWPVSGAIDDRQESGLSFWYFVGPHDGEDIKEDFKTRVVEIEHLLTINERQDIILEANKIFIFCGMMVEELDDYAASRVGRGSESWLSLSLKRILPTGMVELLGVLGNSVMSLGCREKSEGQDSMIEKKIEEEYGERLQ